MKRLLKNLLLITMLCAFVISAAVVSYAATTYDSEGSSSSSTSDDTPATGPGTVTSTVPDKITSSTYTISGEYVFVESTVTKSAFLNNIEPKPVDTNYTIDVYPSAANEKAISADSVVKTGCVVSIIDKSSDSPKERKDYTIILRGDVNCDGLIDHNDVSAIYNHVKGTSTLTGTAFQAADYDANSTVDINDVIKLSKKSTTEETYTVSIDGKSTIDVDYPEIYTITLKSSSKISYFSLDITFDSSKFEYSMMSATGWTVDKEAASNGKLSIVAHNYNNTSDVVIKVSFKAKAGGSSNIKVENAIGLDTNGVYLSSTGASKSVTVSSPVVKPSAPTKNAATTSSITINTTSGYYYACSTSTTAPSSSSSSWEKATKSTMTFSDLNDDTTYYFFCKDSNGNISDATAIKTDAASSVLSSPSVDKDYSEDTTIAIGLGTYDKIYIGKTNEVPSKDSDGWASLSGSTSGYVYIGNTRVSYTINESKKIILFSGLTNETLYYFRGMEDGVISSYYTVTTAPAIKNTSISIDGTTIKLPFTQGYWYALDSTAVKDFHDPTNATTTSKAITLKNTTTETIKMMRSSSSVSISGFTMNKSYTLYVKKADSTNHYGVPQAIPVKITSSNSAPSAPKYDSNTCTTITVKYEAGVMYSIDKMRWTDATYEIYPTASYPEVLGTYKYYFDDYYNPTTITFANIDPGDTYKTVYVYAAYPNSSQSSSLPVIIQHKWGAAYGRVEPTETLDGYYKRKCSECLEVDTVTIPKTGCAHSDTKTSTVAATCTTEGYVVTTCNKCSKEVSRTTIPKTNHSYTTQTVNATCVAAGYTRTYCSTCGSEASRTTIPKLSHTFTDVTTPSTCSSHGSIQHKCSLCGYVESAEELPLLDHKFEWMTTIEPTSSTEGLKIHKCSVCQNIDEEQTIPKLVNKITNADGSITYEISVSASVAELATAAKEAVANGGNVRVVFSDGSFVVFDKSTSASLVSDTAVLELLKITDASMASGDVVAAGLSSELNAIYEISLDGVVVFGKLNATVTLPYQMPPVSGVEPRVYYVDAIGNKTNIKNVSYDAVKGTVTFNAEHFSTYVVTAENAKSGSGSGATIAIITIVAVLLALGGTFGYIVYTSNKTKKKKFRF